MGVKGKFQAAPKRGILISHVGVAHFGPGRGSETRSESEGPVNSQPIHTFFGAGVPRVTDPRSKMRIAASWGQGQKQVNFPLASWVNLPNLRVAWTPYVRRSLRLRKN